MENEIILVDLNDKEIGYKEKMETHRLPALHRAFSVFLYKVTDEELYLLLQKRAEGKYHSGGLWTNTCCSHPARGEILEEAVPRRMQEELGMTCDVQEIFSFTYFHRFSSECAEYEFDHVFIGEWDGKVFPDPEEISEVAWIKWKELQKQMMERPDDFSPWFMIAMPKVAAWIEKERNL